jgi:hypothetical protein
MDRGSVRNKKRFIKKIGVFCASSWFYYERSFKKLKYWRWRLALLRAAERHRLTKQHITPGTWIIKIMQQFFCGSKQWILCTHECFRTRKIQNIWHNCLSFEVYVVQVCRQLSSSVYAPAWKLTYTIAEFTVNKLLIMDRGTNAWMQLGQILAH